MIRQDGFRDYLAISWGKKPVPDYLKVPNAESQDEAGAGEFDAITGPLQLAELETFPEIPGGDLQDWLRVDEPVFPLISPEHPVVESLSPVLVSAPVGAGQTAAEIPPSEPVRGGIEAAMIAEFSSPEEPPVTESPSESEHAAPGLKMKNSQANVLTNDQLARLAAGLAGEADKVTAQRGATEGGKLQAESQAAKVNENSAERNPDPKNASLPSGLLISGRPGHVRSPYAKTHQIVDVTGVKPGTAVMCPFSGKLFLVPAVQEASNRATSAAVPPPGR